MASLAPICDPLPPLPEYLVPSQYQENIHPLSLDVRMQNKYLSFKKSEHPVVIGDTEFFIYAQEGNGDEAYFCAVGEYREELWECLWPVVEGRDPKTPQFFYCGKYRDDLSRVIAS